MSSTLGKTPPVQLTTIPGQIAPPTQLVASATALYNRVVMIMRAKTPEVSGGQQQVGYVGYSGEENVATPTDPEGYTVLFTGIPCVIQAASAGRTKNQWLPSDVVYKPMYLILIPASALPIYSVRDRDLLEDDEGYRYEVGQNTWTAAGYSLSVVRLET